MITFKVFPLHASWIFRISCSISSYRLSFKNPILMTYRSRRSVCDRIPGLMKISVAVVWYPFGNPITVQIGSFHRHTLPPVSHSKPGYRQKRIHILFHRLKSAGFLPMLQSVKAVCDLLCLKYLFYPLFFLSPAGCPGIVQLTHHAKMYFLIFCFYLFPNMPAHQYFPLFCHFSISRSYVTSTLQAMTYQSCLPASAHQNYLRSLPRSLQMYPDLQAFLHPFMEANMQQTSPVPWCGLFPYRLDHFRGLP